MNTIIVLVAKYLFVVSIALASFVFYRSKPEVRQKLLWLSIITLPLSLVIAKLSSLAIYDPRPFVVMHVTPLIAHAADNGFPSDHTLLTMTIATIIFVYNKRWGMGLAVIALMVGASRVAAMVHHPLDIAGSVVIAIVATYLGVWLQRKMGTKNQTNA